MDETEIIKRIMETGEASLGSKNVKKLLKTGKPKLVIVSDNCPRQTREDLEHYTKLSGVPLHEFQGTSLKLGEICRKPFPISAMAIIKPGQANISQLRSGKK
jgi:large subunit ribosomal protein L30e